VTLPSILDVVIMVVLVIGGWFLKSFFPSYAQEKGKNLATKEDIGLITRAVEEVKQQYSRDLERLRASLDQESDAISRRRSVYDGLVSGLSVFVQGQSSPDTDDLGADLVAAYRNAWLWAPDDVVRGINRVIDLNRTGTEVPKSEKELAIRDAYATAILLMRRDVGHEDTQLEVADYQFFRF
jgi:hypothetical protein